MHGGGASLRSPPLPLSPAGGPMVGGEGILELDDDLLIRLWPADRVLVSIIFLCMAYRSVRVSAKCTLGRAGGNASMQAA